MRTFIARLVFVVLAVKGESGCTREKTVGDICYQLVENEKGINTTLFGCKDGCVYTTGSGQDRICFKSGGFPVLDTCPAKNQTQEIVNERFKLLETTSEALLEMAKRSVYQLRPKEQIMDCQNMCMMDETIKTFEDFRNCSQTCISQFSTYTEQTTQCMAAGAPLKGRCNPKNTPIPPKIKAAVKIDEKQLCEGTDECAIYRWKCNTTANIEACQQKRSDVPGAYLAAPFPGQSGTFYYLPLHEQFPGICEPVNEYVPIPIYPPLNICGCVGLGCSCDCTCLVFYYPTI